MAVDQDLFKQALSRWGSGVTVVTTKIGELYYGMTASAFSSVSADPPIVLVCINRNADCYERVKQAGQFAVNILATNQVETSNKFASSKCKALRFENLAYTEAASGMPLLDESLASLDCKVVNAVDSGSHCVFFGEVQDVVNREGEPLLYYRGGYRGVADL